MLKPYYLTFMHHLEEESVETRYVLLITSKRKGILLTCIVHVYCDRLIAFQLALEESLPCDIKLGNSRVSCYTFKRPLC